MSLTNVFVFSEITAGDIYTMVPFSFKRMNGLDKVNRDLSPDWV